MNHTAQKLAQPAEANDLAVGESRSCRNPCLAI
jgi:hypothetical protein